MSEVSFLEFEDLIDYATGRKRTGDWVTVYAREERDKEDGGYHSALVPVGDVDAHLNEASWDWDIDAGTPGFTFYFDERGNEYHRFGNDDGVEPLVIRRTFHGLKPSYVEVSEEFRHFHNLYEDRAKHTFAAFDDSGDEVEVVRVSDEKVEIKVKYLKEYLAARGMALLLLYVIDRWSEKSLDELGMTRQNEQQGGEGSDYRYLRFVDAFPDLGPEREACARLLGKKVMRGLANYDPQRSWGRSDRKYEEFIIRVDEDGEEVHHTCDEEELANYFGKNPGAPLFLTPVFFRKEVMAKYYNDPGKFTVDDGYLRCAGYWGMPLDNNHQKYVVVFLGDLGKLPHKEQLYWKRYNVSPDGKMSDVYFRRSMLGEWADATEPALVFKRTYERFGDHWNSQQGWELFKKLKPADAHHWTSLHVPSDGNQKEFDEQIMSLTKLLVDRINEAEVGKRATLEPNDKGGITKFGRYLDAIGFTETGTLIQFLRNLQSLRSGAAHVKNTKSNSDYQKAVRFFDLGTKGLSQGFADILDEATVFIGKLEEHVVTTTDEEAS
ncbi:hypothetical protein [Streptomyces scabiei]|uniref:hypothetical protein n=1 Tax=Streptomyces scabiei TaxID=1930 RepID=UPI001B32292D|nr:MULTISPECIES: hypothetical protein [Streptomyces]MBP5895216.1 hypothetical protein [Streptomyces sp. LBUM 1481]MBP5925495.1 hypothetical protein [Streptomyces sp. LBUM 1483]MDX2684097.1 hypothetical protein [Streptomyces scabiei]MDX2748896.1 hypothetical protein [Streptomyces scabiei]MDX2803085.1 hypothetical protein [Streptomyces scabiei]